MNSSIETLKKARDYARREFNRMRQEQHCHESHTAAAALEKANDMFSLGMYGVDGDCAMNGKGHIDMLYLNAGDTYATTIIFRNGRFSVGCWGDIVERKRM